MEEDTFLPMRGRNTSRSVAAASKGRQTRPRPASPTRKASCTCRGLGAQPAAQGRVHVDTSDLFWKQVPPGITVAFSKYPRLFGLPHAFSPAMASFNTTVVLPGPQAWRLQEGSLPWGQLAQFLKQNQLLLWTGLVVRLPRHPREERTVKEALFKGVPACWRRSWASSRRIHGQGLLRPQEESGCRSTPAGPAGP